MRILTRDFTPRERILLLILGLIILGLVYYLAVDQVVRNGIKVANIEIESLEGQVAEINKKVQALDEMEEEMKEIEENGESITRMPSYSGNTDEVKFLHDTLRPTGEYSVVFSDLTREGYQIRRTFSLSYKCDSYASAVEVMKNLESSDIRCIIDDLSVENPDASNDYTGNILTSPVTVSCKATFFETMEGAVEDKDLPEDSLSEEAADEEESDYLTE